MTRELTVEEIEMLVESHGIAAEMAKAAGVDAIEILGHGGYLLDQFHTSLWNRRTDRYGGDLDGRLRFSMEIIDATRSAVGASFPIIFRYAADHYMEGGRDLVEGLAIAGRLEAAGVDALHVCGGCYEVWPKAIPCMYEPAACQVNLSEAVKGVVRIPVIADGKLGRPDVAERVLQEGKADFIGLGRPLLADPEWADKVREGRIDDIRPCIGDNEGCMRFHIGRLGCTVNPITGGETEYAVVPTRKRKSVLVVGGGPGGLEAAMVAALRGHRVTLWERSARLGGLMVAASVPDFKQDMRSLIEYLSTQVNKLGVEVHFMKEATLELVQQFNPEVVIVAVGAASIIPDIPGAKGDNVLSAVDLLLGNREPGETVVMAGGSAVGCETAAYLARKGKKVTVVARRGLIPEGMNANSRTGLLNLVKESGVEVLTATKLVEIGETGAIVDTDSGKRELKADSIVLALGLQVESTLRGDLEGKVPELYAVGDCVEPRKILNAIWEGFHVACSI